MVIDNGLKIIYPKRVMLKVHLPGKKSLVVSVVVVAVLALAAAPSYYFYDKYQKSQQLLKNPTEATRAEVKTIVERVSRHIELPNEEPTMATVSDKDKLKEQAFFAKAENGDKVLIYTQTRKAILYRMSTDKIIEVSTVNLGGAAEANASASPNSAEIKIVLRNGTSSVGLTNKLEPEIKKALPNTTIVKKENAARNDYEKTLVIVLNDELRDKATSLAQNLNTTITTLPSDESKPADADILVIIAKDKAPPLTPSPIP